MLGSHFHVRDSRSGTRVSLRETVKGTMTFTCIVPHSSAFPFFSACLCVCVLARFADHIDGGVVVYPKFAGEADKRSASSMVEFESCECTEAIAHSSQKPLIPFLSQHTQVNNTPSRRGLNGSQKEHRYNPPFMRPARTIILINLFCKCALLLSCRVKRRARLANYTVPLHLTQQRPRHVAKSDKFVHTSQ